MTYNPIAKGTSDWDVPVNAAFVDQDTRITTNTSNINSAQTAISTHTSQISGLTSEVDVLQALLDTLERQPNERGFISWTQQPESTQSVGTAPPTGSMRLQRHKVRKSTTITNLHVVVLTVGSGLTAGQNFLGLYDSAGNLLAQSADQSTAWTGAGLKTTPLTTPYVAAAGDYYVGILAVGTTPPAFARGHDNSSSFMNGLTASGQHLYISHGAGLTALPATVTLTTTSGTSFWSGTS